MNDSDRPENSRAWLDAQFRGGADAGRDGGSGSDGDSGGDGDSGVDVRSSTVGSADVPATALPRAAVPAGGAAFVWGLKPRTYDDDSDDGEGSDDDDGPDDEDSDDEGEMSLVPQPAPGHPPQDDPATEQPRQDEPATEQPRQDEPQSPRPPEPPTDPPRVEPERERQPAPPPGPEWVPPSRDPAPYPGAPSPETSPEAPQPLAPTPLEVPIVPTRTVPDAPAEPPSSEAGTLSGDTSAEPDAQSADGSPILSMEEVLDAPSPRRAAREAEAREAEARAAADPATATGPSADDGARQTDRMAPAEGREDPVPKSPDSERAEAGEAAAADSASPSPDEASGIDSLFDSDGDSDSDSNSDSDGAVVRATAAPLMDGPVWKWAETLRQASGRAESEAHESALASAPSTGTTRRPASGTPMSATQKGLFWALALIIVVGLVLLVVLLTQQDDAAPGSARQPMSTSYGSDSTSSMTPLRISSGRNG